MDLNQAFLLVSPVFNQGEKSRIRISVYPAWGLTLSSSSCLEDVAECIAVSLVIFVENGSLLLRTTFVYAGKHDKAVYW